MGRPFVIGGLLVLAALSFASCTGSAYEGACGRPEGCASGGGGGGSGGNGNGISCLNGVCSCESAGEVACCIKGETDCAVEEMACKTEAECSALQAECAQDDDCPGPPDSRCGVPRCKEGTCELEIWAGQEIPNQFPGDCKVNRCTFSGEVEAWAEPADIPMDGNPCTTDLCDGDMPVNELVPDKFPCPGLPQGVCDDGKCWECSLPLEVGCPSQDQSCYWDKCVPHDCMDGKQNGQETDWNCGGGSCHTCDVKSDCLQGSDCTSRVCQAGKCVAATHSDGVKNGDETGVDCGYPGGPSNTCKDGEGCKTSEDCMSRVCYLGMCHVPTCLDTIKNGTETDTDCGGDCSSCQN